MQATLQHIITGNEPENNYAQLVSPAHRKKFAQFFTPFTVARFMAAWILANQHLKTVLDPAFGLGVFARAIREKNKDCSIKGFDIDTYILEQAVHLFNKDIHTDIQLKDYMLNDWEHRYDGIICNPPYFKFHDYENKSTLKIIEKNLGLRLNGFTNLYTLFLLKSAYQLNAGGRAAYIVPSEFLNSDYGKLVKSYLIKNKLLRYIIVFDFEENVFEDALTTASILLFANDNQKSEVEFLNIKTLNELIDVQNLIAAYPKTKSKNAVSFSTLNPEIKWRAYYQKQNASSYKNLVPFANFGKVVRGIATGANEYFTFNLSKAKQFGIDEHNLLPCIIKSVDVAGAFFTQDNFDDLKHKDRLVYLLNATDPAVANLKKYLDKGEAEGIHKKFLTASRNPWYALENRVPAPIWVSVFNRNGLRFIRNEAGVSNLTTFHCIYPAQSRLFNNLNIDTLFAYLLTNTAKEIFQDNRREYGNGLQKFEPNDINKALMPDLSLLSKEMECQILELYEQYRKTVLDGSPDESLVNSINELFLDEYAL